MAYILAIDDEELVRFTIGEVLGSAGHLVTTVGNGVEAFDHLDRINPAPDVILCDLNMPEMGGVEFLRQLALRDYAGPVLIISGLDNVTLDVAQALAQYRQLNVCGHIQKPFSPEAIEAAVEKALGQA